MRLLKVILIALSVSLLIFSCGKKENTNKTKNDDPFALADSLTFKALFDSSNSVLLPQLETFLADSNYEFYIDAVNRIAANYRKVANYDSAFAYVTKAIEISETRRGDTVNLHIAQTYYLLGLMYKDYQISKDALLYLNKSLKIRETLLPENDPLIGDVYNNIGVIYYIKEDLEKAVKYFHEALNLRKQRGFYDKSVGSTYMNLGNIYSDLNEFTKSLAYFDTALTIQKKVLGDNHPAVGSILHNIAGNYNEIGEIDSSLVYYKNALKIYRNVFGENHPLVANVYNNIGLYYKSVGDYENAINFFENSVKIKKNLGDAFKKELVDNYANMGMTYRNLEKYDLSIEAYKKALRLIEEKKNDFGVKKFANVARGLSLTYKSVGENELALATIREAVKRTEESSGKDDLITYRTKIFLSSVLNKTGGYGESIKNSKECIEFFKSKNNVIWLVFSYELLAEGYLMNEEFDQTLDVVDSLRVLFSDRKSGELNMNKINNYPDVNAMLSETLGFAGMACFASFEKTGNEKYLDRSHDIYLTIVKLFAGRYGNILVESSKILGAEKIKKFLYTGMNLAYEKFIRSPNEDNFAYALKLSEFVKAITVLENVKKHSALSLAKISDPEKEKLLSLQKTIGYYSRLLSYDDNNEISDEAKNDYGEKLITARMEYDELNRALAEKNPIYKEMTKINVDISLSEIRDFLLDEDQSAVEYFSSGKELYSFVVTPDTFAIVKKILPDDFESEIEKLIKSVKTDNYDEFITSSQKVYGVVFSVADNLISTPRLLIINDGVLGYIPYDILLYEEPIDNAGYQNLPYLIKKYSIGYAYSFNLLRSSANFDNTVSNFLGIAPFSKKN